MATDVGASLFCTLLYVGLAMQGHSDIKDTSMLARFLNHAS